jgi:hypothetical protein
MQLDIYRRPEPEHKLSYMAVPAGQPIRAEADNIDWKLVASAHEIDIEKDSLPEYGIDKPAAQIREKGYAITSVYHQVEADS